MIVNYPSITAAPNVLADYPTSSRDANPNAIFFVGRFGPSDLSGKMESNETVVFEDYREAAYYLQHIPQKHSKFPEFIVGYHDKNDLKNISEFAGFLTNYRSLAAIPFILLHREEHLSEVGCRTIRGIDDIVRDDISPEELLKKVAFLKKFKALRQGTQKSIRYSPSEIRRDRRPLLKIDALFKRIMDILLSGIALIILAPLMLLIALIIRLDSKGPVFYTSLRAGSDYRIFKFIKYRSMVAEADNKLSKLKGLNQYGNSESTPVFFKINNDPRITRFGKFLRNTSLDELPQLFNVFKGDMSVVGNRPLPLYEAKTLTTDLHAERFIAPAGITGLWQISKRGQKEMSAEERIALDIDYARHNSFVQDLQIMLKTPKALIQKENV